MKRKSNPSGKGRDRSGGRSSRSGDARKGKRSGATRASSYYGKRDEEARSGDDSEERTAPRASGDDDNQRSGGDRGKRFDGERSNRQSRSFGKRDDRRPQRDRSDRKPLGDRVKREAGDRKPLGERVKREDDRRPFSERNREERMAQRGRDGRKPFGDRVKREDDRRPFSERNREERMSKRGKDDRKPFSDRVKRDGDRPGFNRDKRSNFKGGKPSSLSGRSLRPKLKLEDAKPHDSINEEIRLNRYIASAGVCSRREADTLIESGVVTVNGTIVTELGTRVKRTDQVKVAGETLRSEKPRYLLLNKPKDYITTMSDPRDRKTVMHLLGNQVKERVYPVGRLDRATTGLLVLTNDGDLATKLAHPKHGVQKVYRVQVNQQFKAEHLHMLLEGFELDDGFIQADEASYAGTGDDKHLVGIELHSGRNRIVRRMMEHLGYKVVALDRVSFGGLTKRALPRGTFRELTPQEIGYLKMT